MSASEMALQVPGLQLVAKQLFGVDVSTLVVRVNLALALVLLGASLV